jgi:hypothetical protein
MDENTDPLGFLAKSPIVVEGLEAAPAPPEPQAAPEGAPEPEPAAQGRPRGEDGNFLPTTAEASPAQARAAPATEPAPTVAEPERVPVAALREVREKRQAAERERDALRAENEALKAAAAQRQAPQEPQRPQQPLPLPTALEQLQVDQYRERFKNSRWRAEQQYGREAIEEAYRWAFDKCDHQSPNFDQAFNERLKSSEDPYEDVHQAFDREKVLAAVSPADLGEFQSWRALKAQVQAAQPASPPQTAAQPLPRSLATAPGNGGAGVAHVPVGEGEAFSAAFGR